MLTIEKTALSAALALCAEAIERRNTIPILQNVKIVGSRADGSIAITATNLDIEVTARAKADFSADQVAFTLPGATLKDIVAKVADGSVTLDPGERSVAIRAGRSRFSLPILPVSDFPEMPPVYNAAEINLKASDLSACLTAVRFAISTEETRYYLNGIHIHRTGERLVFVATDGHRLAKRTLELETPEFSSVIVPRHAIPVLLKLLARVEEATLWISPERIRVAGDGVTLTSKLIDGTFPDYQRVIPAATGTVATLDAEPVSAAIDRVSTVASGKDSRVRFTFQPGTLKLEAASSDAGEAEDTIACEGETELATAYNGRYAIEAIANLGTKQFEMIQTEAGSPALLRAPGNAYDLVVIMPMRI